MPSNMVHPIERSFSRKVDQYEAREKEQRQLRDTEAWQALFALAEAVNQYWCQCYRATG